MHLNLTELILFGVISLFSSLSSLAGGWGSGGGENIGDLHNPWFLGNTKLVTYCIQVDSDSISASKTTIQHLVSDSIQQWQKLFARYQENNSSNLVVLGSQTWLEVKCGSAVDVQFKFGWGTLNSDEKAYLSMGGSPERYIGISVRTHYNEVNLRGKGFIYIASDLGPNAFEAESGQIETPWHYPALIQAELLHELGHVNGFSHLSANLIPDFRRGLMSEYFPQAVLQKWMWQGVRSGLKSNFKLGELFFPDEFEICAPSIEALKILKLNKHISCLDFKLNFTSGLFSSVSVFSRSNLASPQLVATIILGNQARWTSQNDISVYLSKNQTVFPNQKNVPYIFGPSSETYEGSAQYSSTGSKVSLYLAISGDGFKMISVRNDSSFFELLSADPKN